MTGPQRPEPQTEAGRALLRTLARGKPDTITERYPNAWVIGVVRDALRDIEARAAERTETAGLREALEAFVAAFGAYHTSSSLTDGYDALVAADEVARRALAADPRPPEHRPEWRRLIVHTTPGANPGPLPAPKQVCVVDGEYWPCAAARPAPEPEPPAQTAQIDSAAIRELIYAARWIVNIHADNSVLKERDSALWEDLDRLRRALRAAEPREPGG